MKMASTSANNIAHVFCSFSDLLHFRSVFSSSDCHRSRRYQQTEPVDEGRPYARGLAAACTKKEEKNEGGGDEGEGAVEEEDACKSNEED